jgi:hypothetical protein
MRQTKPVAGGMIYRTRRAIDEDAASLAEVWLRSRRASVSAIPPNEMLGSGPVIGVSATISVRRDGTLVQMDRGGNPSFNPILMPDDAKDEFNARHPADDVENYLKPLSGLLEDQGYPHDEAVAAVLSVFPDVLHYNRNQPASYPNGRAITGDVFSARMAFLTHGPETSEGLKPHQDLLPEFPFLGVANAVATS